MKIGSTALSLNVADTAASADFAIRHFGFTEEMSADGFVSLTHPDAGFNIVFLRTGLSTFKPESVAGPAGQGMLIAFVVDDVDTEFARIAEAGATVVTEPETEPWGERYCQFADPNGIVWQLVHWVSEPA
ncbi:Glyoxalase-like domain-containing protein [Rhodococcus rhodochrous J3]|jgi:predicted enzyme related to lactoylglutathione lyase|uniref:VOC family protein n=2 Tax=Rhodococcus rhodochrous TaxID=1829 RepID=A0AA46WTD2_RHORH|nr:VOC family protein [Rhodococcus rhodochrous]AYA26936.1 glyoxalase [Rhodococcus rhodochrous]MBF4477146.1 VOC family protein [Rhodococcus rhodochrous]MCB8909048.1 VOC family protein [Rhodococcus rhodochrous]MCD2096200.1 VOC family protein [Rhodococcus rhodochrous]MCD2120958.1 VOC family protein [Rhodococcus rhodochrous]